MLLISALSSSINRISLSKLYLMTNLVDEVSRHLSGLAKVLMGGGGQQQQSGQSAAGGIFKKLLDMDGDGSMMDDLLNIGMKILKK